jgi:hypothetical protein
MGDRLRDDGPGRARRERLVEEEMPVGRLALQGDEQMPGLDLARVERDSDRLEAALGRTPGRGGDLPGSPERRHDPASPAPKSENQDFGARHQALRR